MTGDRLLRLYPRAWRQRYGPEFLDLLGSQQLRLPQIIDVVSGALDAHLSSDLRASAVRGPVTGPRGGTMVSEALKRTCARTRTLPFTFRDGWYGAGAIVLASIGMRLLVAFFKHQGMPALAIMSRDVSLPVALLMSVPFMWMKGQPWRAQVAVVGGTLAILALIVLT